MHVQVLVDDRLGGPSLRGALAVETLARAALGRAVLVRELSFLAASLRDRVLVLRLRRFHHHHRIVLRRFLLLFFMLRLVLFMILRHTPRILLRVFYNMLFYHALVVFHLLLNSCIILMRFHMK